MTELCYRKGEEGYRDADLSSSSDDRCSTSGYWFSLNRVGPLMSWKSRGQPINGIRTGFEPVTPAMCDNVWLYSAAGRTGITEVTGSNPMPYIKFHAILDQSSVL